LIEVNWLREAGDVQRWFCRCPRPCGWCTESPNPSYPCLSIEFIELIRLAVGRRVTVACGVLLFLPPLQLVFVQCLRPRVPAVRCRLRSPVCAGTSPPAVKIAIYRNRRRWQTVAARTGAKQRGAETRTTGLPHDEGWGTSLMSFRATEGEGREITHI
jgi:hypothetical protein